MIWSYIKIAFRVLQKNKLISFINIFGLGLSMSVGMMIMIRMQDQFSYDNFHPNPERTYRILTHFNKKSGDKIPMASTPLPLSGKLNTFSIVEKAVNIYPALNGKVKAEGKEFYINGAFTEPQFFEVFGFQLSEGSEKTALQLPNSIVISKNTAAKFFGSQPPVGKIIETENGTVYKVTGIMKDIPGKSHLGFEAYASNGGITRSENDHLLPAESDSWFEFNTAYTYVLLKKASDQFALNKQLGNISSELNKIITTGEVSFEPQRLDRITPGREYLAYETGKGSSWSKIYIELGVSLLILFAACFNYTNLTIARALNRAKEVGVRKIVGAKRYQLFTQYTTESVLVSFLSLAFAWLILSFIVKYAPFNDGYEFIPSSFRYNAQLILWSIVFALFTGILAGLAPSFILSAYKPLHVLKNLITAQIFGKISLQKFFIVFQYSLSLTIIIFLFAFYKQFNFLGDIAPGFKTENVIVLPLNGLDTANTSAEIAQISGVESVAAMSSDLSGRFEGLSIPVRTEKSTDAVALNYYNADENFISSMHLKILSGRNFSPSSSKQDAVILNEKAVQVLGFKKAEDAVGQKIWVNDSTRSEVIGVLKDFHYESAARPIQPLAFTSQADNYNYLYLGISGDKKAIMARIVEAVNSLQPANAIKPVWLDEVLAENNSQSATISLLGFLAFIALAIASLGLLGLVIYTIEVKRKEISIRKIIGASQKQLVKTLSVGFIKLIIIAGLIAMPIGFIISFLFLQNFVNRIPFGFTEILVCFLFLFCIGLLTIISQTYKAASENPAKNLRTE